MSLAVIGLTMAWACAAAHAQINPFGQSDFNLEPDDMALIEAAAERLYLGDGVAPGTVEAWSNSKSGNQGTIKLVSKFQYKDMPCRRLQHEVKVVHVAAPYHFIVDRCQVSSGEWKVLY
ncbi:MAG: hypothetical protein AB7P52_15140 [Alphaproteobacteria bacterium]